MSPSTSSLLRASSRLRVALLVAPLCLLACSAAPSTEANATVSASASLTSLSLSPLAVAPDFSPTVH
ncbi:MAG: hypothetical protein ACHREM_10925, partial [Polyangiales bacterium]